MLLSGTGRRSRLTEEPPKHKRRYLAYLLRLWQESGGELPQWLGGLGLPGMTGMATKMLKKQISDLDIPEVPEFLQLLADSGAQL